MPTDNSLLFARQKSDVISTKGYIGDLRYAPSETHGSYIRNGFNNPVLVAQVTVLSTTTPSVPVGQGFYLEIIQTGLASAVIPVINNTAAAIPFQTLVKDAINGTATTLVTPAIAGFFAVNGATANDVNLSGRAGVTYELASLTSVGGYVIAANTPTTASQGSLLPYGRAITSNPAAQGAVYNSNSIISDNNNTIVALPINNLLTFEGITIRDPGTNLGFSKPGEFEGFTPGSCVHWLPNTGHTNQIIVKLEGTDIPAVDAPAYYRFGGANALNPLGGFSTVASPTVALARDLGSNNYWVIRSVMDTARRLYYIGLKY